MKKITLSEEILKHFNLIPFYQEHDELYKTVKFYLSENIIAIFGKDEFEYDESSFLNQEVILDKIKHNDKTELLIYFSGECYVVSVINDILTILNSNRNIIAQIRPGKNNELTNYRIVAPNGILEKTIAQKVRFGNDKCFDYIEMDKNTCSSTLFRLRPMHTKIEDKEYFEISFPNKKYEKQTIIQRVYHAAVGNIRTIHTSLEKNNLYDYLDEIFLLLKDECEKEYRLKI